MSCVKQCNRQFLYGTTLYGTRIYSSCVSVITTNIYDFEVQWMFKENNEIIKDFEWVLYRRRPGTLATELVDETHILVDMGVSITDILQIDLDTYGLEELQTDYYLRTWRDDNSISHETKTYIRYFPKEYIGDAPYLKVLELLEPTGSSSFIPGPIKYVDKIVEVEKKIPEIKIVSLEFDNDKEPVIKIKDIFSF